jgi:ribosomal protein L37AE/L43A
LWAVDMTLEHKETLWACSGCLGDLLARAQGGIWKHMTCITHTQPAHNNE